MTTAHAARKFAQTKAVEEATGMRTCAHGQHEVAADKGSFVMRGKIKSWMCFGCQVKTGRLKQAASPAAQVVGD